MKVPSQMFIGGRWVDSEDAATLDVVNPANQEVLARIPKASREDARKAIDAASEAARVAAKLPAHERSRILLKVASMLEQNSQEMVETIAKNVGKPVADAAVETARAVLVLTFAAEEAKRITGQTIPLDSQPFPPGNQNRLAFTIREPVGVVGAISPFNFPLNLLMHKVAPAIAAGNSVVAKPPSEGPLPALMIAKLFEQAGLPDGVLNIVVGPGETVGDEIVISEKVNAISFTGGSETGKEISQKAARTNKKVILELGGHNPMIVLDDANLEAAVSSAVSSTFTFSGQVCTATRRIILSEKLRSKFMASFDQAVAGLKVGNPLEQTTNVGPVISRKSLDKIEGLVEDAKSKGAVARKGGNRLVSEEYSRGNYFAPTVLDEVEGDMKIANSEVFGPVAAVMKASKEEEFVDAANSTTYGLQASIYTSDLAKGIKLAKEIKAGAVLINDRTTLRWDNAPFGGVKMSGMGREGVSYAIAELTDLKFIVVNLG
ncbi:MAG: aldehyde dehydrogenase family protein [Thaumarchaeota archaeon]|nr:aldehyde dehydrogenase family protein [Nitrososphaerota archaeon]